MLLARDECEHFASSTMMFMFGGEKLRQRIEDLNASRRRLAFLDRIISGIDAATTSTEQLLQAAQNPAGLEPSPAPPTDDGTFSSLDEELRQLQEEGDIDADWLLAHRHHDGVALGSAAREVGRGGQLKETDQPRKDGAEAAEQQCADGFPRRARCAAHDH